MFKRLREGLFGRTEAEQDQQQTVETPTEEPIEDDEESAAAPVAEAPETREAPEEEEEDAVDGLHSPVATAPEAAPPIATRVETPPVRPVAPQPAVRPTRPPEPPAVSAPPAAPAPQAAAQPEDIDDELEDVEDIEDEEVVTEHRGGLFGGRLRFGLGRTRQVFGRMNTSLEEAEDITDDLWDELEETLITSDVGVQTTEKLLDTLRERVRAESLTTGAELRDALKEELELLLGEPEELVFSDTSPITVVLVVGVNGVGKTTSIAKLGYLLKRQKHRVLFVAGDTFRAAATEQLRLWGERVGVPVISQHHGADAAAVVYDGMQAAQARNADVLVVDTAGRLHTKYNLMEELKKIVRVLQRYDPEAPHDILLVIDATTGQNGFLQAKQFVQDTGVSGIILTKLDGTARGGIAFAVASELGLPIKYIGTGEQVKDMAPFDAHDFVEALFEQD